MYNLARSYRLRWLIKSLIRSAKLRPPEVMDQDLVFQRLYKICRPFTMTSKERMYGLYQSVQYVAKRGLEGDFVECGVWRGGSSILAALTFDLFNDHRTLQLFDTFEGMPTPKAADVDVLGIRAAAYFGKPSKAEVTYDGTCVASLQDVKANIERAGCDLERFRFIPGLVERTATVDACEKIAILRLDTDWYQSTLHELEMFYPKLVPGGVLIVDDYGHWQGARKAVDEYFSHHEPIVLTRLDYSGRIGIKT